MKILVVGGGGREHALAAQFHRESPSAVLYCAPGNPGTAEVAENLPIPADDLDALVDAARARTIDLVVVGPEQPLAMGLADRLRAAGRPVFGPTAAAAAIESSKAFAKDLMARADVPTARYAVFDAVGPALAYLDRHPEPLVVKASGLAAGKGAVVCRTRADAADAVHDMLGQHRFGAAGETVVVEEFLPGEELSVFAITNGQEVILLPAAQDHKRLGEGDTGPNTGGMGAYSPVPLATPEVIGRVIDRVLEPTLAALAARGTPFHGILYAGLMIAPDRSPAVVEFNCRLGDPEAQAVLPLVQDGLLEAFTAAARGGTLMPLAVRPEAAVTTVLAAAGYPDRPRRGDPITLPDALPPGALLYHAGTARDPAGTLRTAGGRVVSCTGVAATLREARAVSLALAEQIHFDGKQYRRDIGWRACPDAGAP